MTDIYEFKPGQKKREEEKREEKTGFDREALIAKILALLAKTVERGCTGPEAKEAAKKARAMMEDYGITIEELKAAEEKAEHTKAAPGPISIGMPSTACSCRAPICSSRSARARTCSTPPMAIAMPT